MIIGLTGLNASGKGTVAEYLKARGFVYYSLSDVIRFELADRGEEPGRENMIRVGNELREKGGPAALAKGIIARIDAAANTVVDSFRNPAEVLEFKKRDDFALLEVTASESTRFERILSRGRVGDPKDIETFRMLEGKELTGSPGGQQLVATAALADQSVENDGDLEQLHAALDAVMESMR